MPKRSISLILVFQALADPTRLAVVERLSKGSVATKELAAPFKMALPSFLQHLDVLRNCGLVRSSKTGRVRTYELDPDALKTAEGWISKQRGVWEQRLDQLDNFLNNDLKEESE
jgi:DNA-binding transcriptional ArsR family regulator